MQNRIQFVLFKQIYIWFFVLLSILPFLYAMFISLKSNDEFLSGGSIFPKSIYWKNYADAWVMGKISLYGFNTLYISAITIAACILFGCTAAFAIEKLLGKSSAIWYNFFVASIVMPIQVIMIPLFKELKALGLLNNIPGILIVYIVVNLPFSIFVFSGFFKAIPNTLIEAARIDGTSYFGSFWRVIFPLCKPITATITIFVGMNVFKDFLIPLVFITNPDLKTLSIGLLNFKLMFSTNWPALFAAVMIQITPLVILFVLLQKTFIEGITAGAVKG